MLLKYREGNLVFKYFMSYAVNKFYKSYLIAQNVLPESDIFGSYTGKYINGHWWEQL